MKLWIKIIISIFVLLILILLCIVIISNHKVNNYITDKINKLSFLDIMQFKNKYSIVIKNKIPIYIFYHVGINGKSTNYEHLINDQLNEIFYSGLYEKCDVIYYGCNGSNSDIILKDFFSPYEKIKPLGFGAIAPNEKTYENKTINAMINISKNSKFPFYGLYLHTKGMTHSKRSNGQWRKHMEHWLIKKHVLCIDILNRGFNTVGTGLIQYHPIYTTTGITNMFLKDKWGSSYCGNFYWFTSNYLKKCNYIDNILYRFNAEFFLFKKYEKNKHINLDTIRYDFYTFISERRYYPHPINSIIKIGVY